MSGGNNKSEIIVSPNICMKGYISMLQLLRQRLAKQSQDQPLFCLQFPDFTALRVCNTVIKSEHSEANSSWSVLKRICTVFRFPAVSCSSVELVGTEQSTARSSSLKMLEDEVEEFIAAETGRDRINRALSNRLNDRTPPEELLLVGKVSQNVFIILFLFKFFQAGINEGQAFKVRNRTTLYGSPSLANKRLANTVIGFGMGKALKFSLKGMMATAAFMSLWRGLCVYFNTSAPWTFAVTSGTVLSLYKTSLGPKGTVGGAIIGSVFGGVAGTLLHFILLAIGQTQQEINYKQVEQLILERRAMRQNPLLKSDDEDEKVD